MTNLPGAVSSLEQHEPLQAAGVDLPLPHLGLDGVLRCRVGGLTTGKHHHLRVGVPELEVLERLQLRPKVPVAIVGPAVADATAFVNCDVGMIERRELVQIFRIECGVVPFNDASIAPASAPSAQAVMLRGYCGLRSAPPRVSDELPSTRGYARALPLPRSGQRWLLVWCAGLALSRSHRSTGRGSASRFCSRSSRAKRASKTNLPNSARSRLLTKRLYLA